MITNINFVEYITLQQQLDQEIGPGIFTVGVDKTVVPKQFYLEYAESTAQPLIDQAITLANQNTAYMLHATQVRLYETIGTVAARAIAEKEKPVFLQSDIQQSLAWLQDQTSVCPACVLYLAMSNSITNIQAAQEIVDSTANYENFMQQVDAIKTLGQTEVMTATDIFACKDQATAAINQIKNL